MPKRVRYRNGLKLDGIHCKWCNRRRKARVYTNRIRWWLRLSCGHVRIPGYILPIDVLVKEGYANYGTRSPEDRYSHINEHNQWNREQKLQEQEEFFKKNAHMLSGNFTGFARGRKK